MKCLNDESNRKSIENYQNEDEYDDCFIDTILLNILIGILIVGFVIQILTPSEPVIQKNKTIQNHTMKCPDCNSEIIITVQHLK